MRASIPGAACMSPVPVRPATPAPAAMPWEVLPSLRMALARGPRLSPHEEKQTVIEGDLRCASVFFLELCHPLLELFIGEEREGGPEARSDHRKPPLLGQRSDVRVLLHHDLKTNRAHCINYNCVRGLVVLPDVMGRRKEGVVHLLWACDGEHYAAWAQLREEALVHLRDVTLGDVMHHLLEECAVIPLRPLRETHRIVQQRGHALPGSSKVQHLL
mmetsp:Transcript_38065/g.113676  ORF Transcript_38065/g.113676 Transcript_38065/m.113676 type:complete len:216 (-) Transcript_38065:287-934(-)